MASRTASCRALRQQAGEAVERAPVGSARSLVAVPDAKWARARAAAVPKRRQARAKMEPPHRRAVQGVFDVAQSTKA